MRNRNYISEILSKRERLGTESNRWKLVSKRLDLLRQFIDLLDLLEADGAEDTLKEFADSLQHGRVLSVPRQMSLTLNEISRYIPIGLVACAEGYFKIAYADLINHGSPFIDNVSSVDIKFSLETAISIQKHSVSIGEFVSHLLTTNNLEDIDSNLTKIIGDSFLKRFKVMRPLLRTQQTIWPVDEDEVNNNIIRNVKRVFELRHMYCHELDPFIQYEEIYSIWSGIESMVEFLWTSENIFTQLLSE